MRVLRMSFFAAIDMPPVTVVTRDSDLRDTLESAVAGQKALEGFLAYEIFEMPDDTGIEAATLEGMNRLSEDRATRERDMATLYFWDAQYLEMTEAHGVLSTTKPSPLSAEDIEATLEQLAEHPSYKHQTVQVHTETGEIVRMVDGKVVT